MLLSKCSAGFGIDNVDTNMYTRVKGIREDTPSAIVN